MTAAGRKDVAVPERNTIDGSNCWWSLTGHERSVEPTAHISAQRTLRGPCLHPKGAERLD